MTGEQLDQLCINTIRTLSIDAVQQAKSGHPGTPMALAPVAYSLWNRMGAAATSRARAGCSSRWPARPLLLQTYAPTDAFSYTDLVKASPHGEELIRGEAARWARHEDAGRYLQHQMRDRGMIIRLGTAVRRRRLAPVASPGGDR